MTYRIDQVRKSKIPAYAWCFEIKGYEGRGEYVTMYTDQYGRKLHKLESISFELIPGTEAFEVPTDATKAEAHRALAMVLDRLGWGPMVDQAGNIVAPFNSESATCARCGAAMLPGKAVEQTWAPGVFGFLEPDLATMHPAGPGRLVDCLKCPKCGHSVTPTNRVFAC